MPINTRGIGAVWQTAIEKKVKLRLLTQCNLGKWLYYSLVDNTIENEYVAVVRRRLVVRRY